MRKSVLFVFAVLLVLSWVHSRYFATSFITLNLLYEGIQKFNSGFYSDLAKSDAQSKGMHCHIKDDVDR
jgi:hypothetical protein